MEKQTVELRLFGRFAVAIDDGSSKPIRITAKKACAFLAYLCLEGRTSRERLATLLWGDQPDPQARHNLRQCLLSLRKDLAAASDVLTSKCTAAGFPSSRARDRARPFPSRFR